MVILIVILILIYYCTLQNIVLYYKILKLNNHVFNSCINVNFVLHKNNNAFIALLFLVTRRRIELLIPP